jgi:CubicO group peptidase (beta-lactamase class C family)
MNKLTPILALFALITSLAGCGSPAAAPASTATVLATQVPTLAPTQTAVAAPTSTPEADAQIAAGLQAALEDLAEQGKLSGAVLVARNGKALVSQGYGMADQEGRLANTAETKFHLASVTKMFTAMAVVLLQKQGKLDVQDPICKYIDDCPSAWQAVTIHSLLTHTSGIHEFNDTAGVAELVRHPSTSQQLIDQFRELPLDFAPGEKYFFSNSGYILLGYLIERVSGRTYGQFIQENIFDPLGMKNSGYDDTYLAGPGYAVGYKNATEPADPVDASILYASAGLYSTVGDLLRWDEALYTESLLPGWLQPKYFSPYDPISGNTLFTGYGWYYGHQYNQWWMYAAGAGAGFSAIVHRFPESHTVIILLSNRQDTDLKGFNARVGPLIFGGEWVSPTK